MPTYIVRTANLALSEDQTSALASAISSAHAACTGAPVYLAQVIVEPIPPSRHFIGGRANVIPHLFIQGLVRAGRTAAQKRALIDKLRDDAGQAASVATEDVWVTLQDIAAEQMVEFGRVLPTPGEEAVWREDFSDAKLAALRRAGVAI